MDNEYTLYCHLFPNGKRYIGITKTSPEKRWSDGKGYKDQQKMARAIEKYGWDNIEHQIITDGLTREQAERLEMYLIDALDTIECGYNVTIGGNRVNGSYLNQHVLEMIRKSKYLDEKYGEEQQPDDIVSFAETGNGNTQRAKIINAVDEYLCEHKDLWFSNVVPRRVDDYWVCFWQLMEYGEIKKTPGQVHQDSMAYGLNLREAVLFTR